MVYINFNFVCTQLKMKVCSYKNCKSHYENKCNWVPSPECPQYPRSLHRVPANPERREAWLKAAGIPPDMKRKLLQICNNHFRPEDFYRYGTVVRLKDDVNPIPYYDVKQIEENRLKNYNLYVEAMKNSMKNANIEEVVDIREDDERVLVEKISSVKNVIVTTSNIKVGSPVMFRLGGRVMKGFIKTVTPVKEYDGDNTPTIIKKVIPPPTQVDDDYFEECTIKSEVGLAVDIEELSRDLGSPIETTDEMNFNNETFHSHFEWTDMGKKRKKNTKCSKQIALEEKPQTEDSFPGEELPTEARYPPGFKHIGTPKLTTTVKIPPNEDSQMSANLQNEMLDENASENYEDSEIEMEDPNTPMHELCSNSLVNLEVQSLKEAVKRERNKFLNKKRQYKAYKLRLHRANLKIEKLKEEILKYRPKSRVNSMHKISPEIYAATVLSKNLPECMQQLLFRIALISENSSINDQHYPDELKKFLVKLYFSESGKAYNLLRTNLNYGLPNASVILEWKNEFEQNGHYVC